ncbi:unnamed protein product, partial [Rotaria sp. Silwood1]
LDEFCGRDEAASKHISSTGVRETETLPSIVAFSSVPSFSPLSSFPSLLPV